MFDGGLTSAALLAGIANNTFVPTTGKPKNRPGERCYASVKVGLLRAGIVRGINPDIPAKGAGPWLLSQGFRDVTATTPDGRWALPGDVLVYRYPDAKEAANDKKFETAMAAYEIEKAKYDASTAASNEKLTLWKNENALFEKAKAEARKAKQTFTTQAPAKPNSKQPKKPSAPTNKNYGHIEVRTYDGYISDFKTVNFALPRNLVLIGVYRKICDPVAELRVLAYLEVIASRETKGFSEEKSWYISNAKIDGSKEVKSIAKHPWVGRPQPTRAEGSRAAGRFQIMLATYTEAVETYGLPDSFLPANQQRIAVLKFETRKGLGLVRAGKIEEATHVLSDEWASLPGGSQNRDYSMSQLLSDHQKFMKELIK